MPQSATTSIEWLLKPKQTREGMFEEEDRLRNMVLKFQEDPTTEESTLTNQRKK